MAAKSLCHKALPQWPSVAHEYITLSIIPKFLAERGSSAIVLLFTSVPLYSSESETIQEFEHMKVIADGVYRTADLT